jgi:hypothetical protein
MHESDLDKAARNSRSTLRERPAQLVETVNFGGRSRPCVCEPPGAFPLAGFCLCNCAVEGALMGAEEVSSLVPLQWQQSSGCIVPSSPDGCPDEWSECTLECCA